jgi:hypothetical protein
MMIDTVRPAPRLFTMLAERGTSVSEYAAPGTPGLA